jgi:hypothetical protein
MDCFFVDNFPSTTFNREVDIEKFTGGDTMRFLINVTGRRNRTMAKLIEAVIEGNEISTPRIVETINMKMGKNLSVTTNQISNWLPKSGCFSNTGRVRRDGMLGGGYSVMLWKVNYEGLRKKYGVNHTTGQADVNGRISYRLQYVIDTVEKTMTPVGPLMRDGRWNEIQETLERDEESNL